MTSIGQPSRKNHCPTVLNAYYLLGCDWRETWKKWKENNHPTPPVMITVCNRTETAARVKHAFDSKRIHIDELCDPDRILHIDSKVLNEAEASEEPIAAVDITMIDEDQEEDRDQATPNLRKSNKLNICATVDTVGKPGKPGAEIKKVISVGMLSEGWDAKTVTHIMGYVLFLHSYYASRCWARFEAHFYETNTIKDPNTGEDIAL